MNDPAQLERYTTEDYRRWEGDWELIRGAPVAMTPSPTMSHQVVCGGIFRQLDEALEDCPHCQAVFEIDVEFAADTVVRPDVLAICHEPTGDWLTRAPELIFEVVSKHSARRDESIKFELYQAEGVTHYVLVYPDLRKVKVYRLTDGAYRKVGDFSDERHDFDLSKCRIGFDFARLWRRKR